MLNHHRGLWGYSGPAADGAPLTIQSTGLGGPSAAAVVAELVALGARRLVRVGTAAGLGATTLGALVVADAALAVDGASRALGAGARVAADPALDAPALAAARRRGLVASADFHDPGLARGVDGSGRARRRPRDGGRAGGRARAGVAGRGRPRCHARGRTPARRRGARGAGGGGSARCAMSALTSSAAGSADPR